MLIVFIVFCKYYEKGASGSSIKTGDDTVADPDYIPPRINSNTYKKECMLGELGSSTKKGYKEKVYNIAIMYKLHIDFHYTCKLHVYWFK